MINLSEFNNIEKNIRRNNAVVLGLIVLFGVVIISFGWFSFKTSTYFANHQLILESNGEVRNVKGISNSEAKIIEIKDHLSKFYDSFYSFDQFNMDNKINTGLWLGDESLRRLYERYKGDSWYNNIIQYNISQTSSILEFEKVDISVYPYIVKIKGVMNLRQGDKIQRFTLNGSCTVEDVGRDFPRNPHGLFIRNWVEEPSKEIK